MFQAEESRSGDPEAAEQRAGDETEEGTSRSQGVAGETQRDYRLDIHCRLPCVTGPAIRRSETAECEVHPARAITELYGQHQREQLQRQDARNATLSTVEEGSASGGYDNAEHQPWGIPVRSPLQVFHLRHVDSVRKQLGSEQAIYCCHEGENSDQGTTYETWSQERGRECLSVLCCVSCCLLVDVCGINLWAAIGCSSLLSGFVTAWMDLWDYFSLYLS